MPTLATIKQNVSDIAKNYGIARMYLFGSYAKGSATPKSDIDFLYEKGKPISLLGVSSMLQDLKEKFGTEIDLVSSDSIESEFLPDVNATKVLIYER